MIVAMEGYLSRMCPELRQSGYLVNFISQASSLANSLALNFTGQASSLASNLLFSSLTGVKFRAHT